MKDAVAKRNGVFCSQFSVCQAVKPPSDEGGVSPQGETEGEKQKRNILSPSLLLRKIQPPQQRGPFLSINSALHPNPFLRCVQILVTYCIFPGGMVN
jgi:hypothetical protein